MNLLKKPIENQLQLATNCSELDTLWQLHTSPYMNVRRAVARNNNIDSKIANKLVNDPVLNVSYMAKQNSKCSINKEFSQNLNNCVLCDKSEIDLNCLDCEYK